RPDDDLALHGSPVGARRREEIEADRLHVALPAGVVAREGHGHTTPLANVRHRTSERSVEPDLGVGIAAIHLEPPALLGSEGDAAADGPLARLDHQDLLVGMAAGG